MLSLDQIHKQLKERTLEDVLEKSSWREFEDFVAEIFITNNFLVKKNFRFKTKKRYEIDIIAVKENCILCIDCKSWSSGRYKRTGLRYAVRNQENRTKELKKFLRKNPIAQNLLKINPNSKFYPLIVTLLEEELVAENGIFVVPMWKLNSFLLEIEKYLS